MQQILWKREHDRRIKLKHIEYNNETTNDDKENDRLFDANSNEDNTNDINDIEWDSWGHLDDLKTEPT